MEVLGTHIYGYDIFIVVTLMLVALISFIANSFILILYYSTPKLRNKKRNLFLVSLAVANVLTSVVAIPLSGFVSR